jgi:hypothetical protein
LKTDIVELKKKNVNDKNEKLTIKTEIDNIKKELEVARRHITNSKDEGASYKEENFALRQGIADLEHRDVMNKNTIEKF